MSVDLFYLNRRITLKNNSEEVIRACEQAHFSAKGHQLERVLCNFSRLVRYSLVLAISRSLQTAPPPPHLGLGQKETAKIHRSASGVFLFVLTQKENLFGGFFARRSIWRPCSLVKFKKSIKTILNHRFLMKT